MNVFVVKKSNCTCCMSIDGVFSKQEDAIARVESLNGWQYADWDDFILDERV